MKRTYFDKYSEFTCIADKCPATCCSGWLIEIDEPSLDMYENFDGDDSEYIRDRIDVQDSSFKQQNNGDCAFLMENGLCYLQKNHGEEFLCTTCDMYPRHVEEFLGVREYSLSVSCPAVAEKFLAEDSSLSWESFEDDVPDEEFEFDEALYEQLVACREHICDILADRSVDFAGNAEYVISYARAVQCAIDEGEITGLSSVEPEECAGLYEACRMFSDIEEMFDVFFTLEVLNEEFVESMHKALGILKAAGVNGILDVTAVDLSGANRVTEFDMTVALERICIYFIFTYYCGSIYDEYYYAVALEAVYNTYMIMLLWKAKAIELSRALSVKDAAEILFKYSRELENSNENLIALEQMLNEK